MIRFNDIYVVYLQLTESKILKFIQNIFVIQMLMKKILYRVFDLYYDGFRNMKLGRTLWLVILIKLFIIFVILKLFFFPDFIGKNSTPGEEADFVSGQLTGR